MEFGSDFHLVDYPKGYSLNHYFKKFNLYVSGRQALIALAMTRKWKRLWIPSYFCEESLECLKRTDIELLHYNCVPFDNPEGSVSKIDAQSNDGILVVNYFGIHGLKKFTSVAEIVEDHTHNLIGEWSRNSKADWCIASLRKTLPIPDGGILWSPKGLRLPAQILTTKETEDIMAIRYGAMINKAKYLKCQSIGKEWFLADLNKTEKAFDGLALSGISHYSLGILSELDIERWYAAKLRNYKVLKEKVDIPEKVILIEPSDSNDVPFSFCLLLDNPSYRNEVRRRLINQAVYPAILWSIKSDYDSEAVDFGNRILSIHCDGRYNEADMLQLSEILNSTIRETCRL